MAGGGGMRRDDRPRDERQRDEPDGHGRPAIEVEQDHDNETVRVDQAIDGLGLPTS